MTQISLTDAVRECIKSLGGDVKATQLNDWLQCTYPELKYAPTSLQPTLMSVKRRLGLIKTNPKSEYKDVPLGKVLRVKEIAAEVGGLDKFKIQVTRVFDACREVGGSDSLLSAIHALDSLNITHKPKAKPDKETEGSPVALSELSEESEEAE